MITRTRTLKVNKPQLNGPFSNHWITSLRIPGGYQGTCTRKLLLSLIQTSNSNKCHKTQNLQMVFKWNLSTVNVRGAKHLVCPERGSWYDQASTWIRFSQRSAVPVCRRMNGFATNKTTVLLDSLAFRCCNFLPPTLHSTSWYLCDRCVGPAFHPGQSPTLLNTKVRRYGV